VETILVDTSPRETQKTIHLTAWAVTAVTLCLLLATSRDYGMVWDEGHTVRRERTLARWFTWVVLGESSGLSGSPFAAKALEQFWPFSREEPDGHPPFYALLGLAGWYVSHGWLSPLTAYRLGPMVLAAVTAGVLLAHVGRRYGLLAGAVAGGAFLLMPRSFAHAHYAHYDMPMTCLWLLAIVAFCNSLASPKWIILFGVLAGLSAGTKFTGWFCPLAPAVWVAIREAPSWLRGHPGDRPAGDDARAPATAGLRSWLCGLVVAAATLLAIQPTWWHNPIRAVERFLASNLTRAETKPIPTLYWGEIHRFGLPWHNTLVLTAITTPVLILLLAGMGIARVLIRRRDDPVGLVWLLSWSVLLVIRAFPQAPGHDGIRQILPSIASLAVLAGIGAAWLREICCRLAIPRFAALVALFAVGESIGGIASLYPYTLSYYNPLVGGLRGAEKHGFELTYYWDTMGPEFLRHVRDLTDREAVELRFPSDLVNIRYLREWGELPLSVPIVGMESTTAPYYVLQRRRGLYYPYDEWLDAHGRACFAIARQGVELLRMYPYEESLRAYEHTKALPTPAHLRQ
jgi:hypothetical protein